MADSLGTRITKAWFEGAIWPRLLLPLTIVFGCIYWVRRCAYRFGLKRSYDSAIPVVVVGNITVGGAGKSPLVSHIVSGLRELGMTPGIVSRGYGAADTIEVPVFVSDQSTPEQVGDEPLMLFQKTGASVAVCPDRRLAVKALAEQGCNIAIADDGLQHLAMSRDIELCVLDAQRLWGNGLMLPAGPLREPLSQLWKSDFVVLNGDSDAPASEKFDTQLAMAHRQQCVPECYRMNLVPTAVVSLDGKQRRLLTEHDFTEVLACAGIGNPGRFYHTLIELGIQFEAKSFDDHHAYTVDDFSNARGRPILMTEKDAVKCRHLGLQDAWFLPVEACLDRPLVNDLVHRLAELGKLPLRNID